MCGASFPADGPCRSTLSKHIDVVSVKLREEKEPLMKESGPQLPINAPLPFGSMTESVGPIWSKVERNA